MLAGTLNPTRGQTMSVLRTSPTALRRSTLQLLETGYVEFDIDPGILLHNTSPLVQGMQMLTGEPEYEKYLPGHIASIDEVGWKMEAGVFRRNDHDAKGGKENKYFFHFAPHARAPGTHEFKVFREFLSSCEALNTAAKEIGLLLALEIDSLHQEKGLALPQLHPALRYAHTITRILRYLDLGENETSADAYTHLDRSVFSVHWLSTHPGLIIFDRDGRPHKVLEMAYTKVAVFLGMKFAGIFAGNGRVREARGIYGFGTPHGVRDTRRRDRMRFEDRFAFVSFVHAMISSGTAQWIRKKKDEMVAYERAHPL